MTLKAGSAGAFVALVTAGSEGAIAEAATRDTITQTAPERGDFALRGKKARTGRAKYPRSAEVPR
jgi:hypothetical protein